MTYRIPTESEKAAAMLKRRIRREAFLWWVRLAVVLAFFVGATVCGVLAVMWS